MNDHKNMRTDHRTYLHAKPEHEKSLNNRTPSKLKEKNYSDSLLRENVNKVIIANRKDLLRSKESSKTNQMLLGITYHRILPNMSK